MRIRLADFAARAWRLPLGEARDVVVAAVLLVRASLALNLTPFSKAISSGAIPLRRRDTNGADQVDRWVTAVTRASYAVPWRSVCIHQGIALQRLLRRAGVPAILCYGTAQLDGELKSHVWVNVGSRTVIGGDEAPKYILLATYPVSAGPT